MNTNISALSSLQAAIPLVHQVKFYVPSTLDLDKPIDDVSPFITRVEVCLSQWFGGATAYPALGVWLSGNGQLVTERVTIVQSFANESSFQEFLPNVVALAGEVKRDMLQESVAVEVDNQLYLF